MDGRQRLQIELLISQRSRQLKGTLFQRFDALKTQRAMDGTLQSGFTINAAARLAAEAIEQLSADLLSECGEICRDLEAHGLVQKGVATGIEIAESQFWPIVRLATGQPEKPLDHGVERAAAELVDQIKQDAKARLEIARFDFDVPGTPEAPAEAEPAAPPLAGMKTGRPPAAFWDDLWSAMAGAIYSGELDPKTQAEIEKAMSEWIVANGYSASDSTVRTRARKLWHAMHAAK